MLSIAITNALIVNEGKQEKGTIIINKGVIENIIYGTLPPNTNFDTEKVINAEGLLLLPGVIDDHVHFREPGLTHKGDMDTESRAAVAGGVTSVMEMPNTNPQTTTIDQLEAKFEIAARKSLVNHSFYLGATNDNIEEIKRIDSRRVCGVKVFMGSSTGNMLVSDRDTLDKIFKLSPTLIVTHCEDETTIRNNSELFKQKFGENLDFKYHTAIRSEEACYTSSKLAVEMAHKHGSRLHILHISTAKELSLLDNSIPLRDKRITGEVCVHHLWFSNKDYDLLKWRIKWNPSVKTEQDRLALIDGLKNNLLDVVATDHAPHVIAEKDNTYFKSASGGPMIQHSLLTMLELVKRGDLTLETVVDKMCHAPAVLYRIVKRGFIRKGYHADIVLVNPNAPQTVSKDNILYKCGWSPLEGTTLNSKVALTMVNGNIVYENGNITDVHKGKALEFDV